MCHDAKTRSKKAAARISSSISSLSVPKRALPSHEECFTSQRRIFQNACLIAGDR